MSNIEQSREPVRGESTQLRTHVGEMENRENEWRQTEGALEESLRLAFLIREVSEALIQFRSFQGSLQLCTQSLVTHLHSAFARIWTLNQHTDVLELQASSGLYTHLDGPHSRVPVGTLKIGLIAAERQPHLTNSVIGDTRVSDQEWAQREGMIAFAGYPLIAGDQVMGVMALFARMPLSSAVLDAMASVANAIALGIERARIEEMRNHLLLVEQQARQEAQETQQRLIQILDNLTDGFMLFDHAWRYTYINPQAFPFAGKPPEQLLGQNVWEVFPHLVGSTLEQQYRKAVAQQKPVAFEIYMELLSAWFDVRAYPISDGLAVYFRNINERKEGERERERLLALEQEAHAAAEAALSMRNAFLSTISHDLKTPLATIKGSTQLILRRLRREQIPETGWVLERLNLVESSTTRMTGMIEDLLNLAKLQAGQQPEFVPVSLDLVTVVRRVVAEQQLTTRQHQLVVEARISTLSLEGDGTRLERVLTNLLSNAIKYSPQGGQIRVEIREIGQEEDEQGAWGVISVHDQGMGIPEEGLAHVFEPFYRAANVVEDIQGTGIGLASVAQVIEQHGGTVSVLSEEGKGSTFIVRLPLSTRNV
ncbi:MAG: ATP-binding protein [Ktedonobacteraceae bacterium]